MATIRTGSKHIALRVWSVVGIAMATTAALCVGGSAQPGAAQAAPSPVEVKDQPPLSKVRTAGAALADDGACVRCHRFEPVLNHPVGVKPSMTVPAGFPLRDGAVTCSTCHEATVKHGESREKVGVRGGVTGSGLCVMCHQGASLKTKASHTVGTWKAHLKSENRLSAGVEGPLDAESNACTGCHDGATARDAGSHAMQGSGMEATADHPIGVPMRRTLGRGESDFKLANPAGLDRRIRLNGGNLGCGSCHSVYSREPAELVMSNRGSKLCLSCHVP